MDVDSPGNQIVIGTDQTKMRGMLALQKVMARPFLKEKMLSRVANILVTSFNDPEVSSAALAVLLHFGKPNEKTEKDKYIYFKVLDEAMRKPAIISKQHIPVQSSNGKISREHLGSLPYGSIVYILSEPHPLGTCAISLLVLLFLYASNIDRIRVARALQTIQITSFIKTSPCKGNMMFEKKLRVWNTMIEDIALYDDITSDEKDFSLKGENSNEGLYTSLEITNLEKGKEIEDKGGEKSEEEEEEEDENDDDEEEEEEEEEKHIKALARSLSMSIDHDDITQMPSIIKQPKGEDKSFFVKEKETQNFIFQVQSLQKQLQYSKTPASDVEAALRLPPPKKTPPTPKEGRGNIRHTLPTSIRSYKQEEAHVPPKVWNSIAVSHKKTSKDVPPHSKENQPSIGCARSTYMEERSLGDLSPSVNGGISESVRHQKLAHFFGEEFEDCPPGYSVVPRMLTKNYSVPNLRKTSNAFIGSSNATIISSASNAFINSSPVGIYDVEDYIEQNEEEEEEGSSSSSTEAKGMESSPTLLTSWTVAAHPESRGVPAKFSSQIRGRLSVSVSAIRRRRRASSFDEASNNAYQASRNAKQHAVLRRFFGETFPEPTDVQMYASLQNQPNHVRSSKVNRIFGEQLLDNNHRMRTLSGSNDDWSVDTQRTPKSNKKLTNFFGESGFDGELIVQEVKSKKLDKSSSKIRSKKSGTEK